MATQFPEFIEGFLNAAQLPTRAPTLRRETSGDAFAAYGSEAIAPPPPNPKVLSQPPVLFSSSLIAERVMSTTVRTRGRRGVRRDILLVAAASVVLIGTVTIRLSLPVAAQPHPAASNDAALSSQPGSAHLESAASGRAGASPPPRATGGGGGQAPALSAARRATRTTRISDEFETTFRSRPAPQAPKKVKNVL